MSAPRGRLPYTGLILLAGGIFVSMSTEFLPGGLIPQITEDFDRTTAQVGQLVTGFALTVVITTTPLTVMTRAVPRKQLLLVAFSGIVVANLITAGATTFSMLLAARILCGASHGLFWSVVFAYTAHLVAPHQLGRATTITAIGGSAASVLGVPLGNALGQAAGWRASFLAFGLVGLVVLALIWALLPTVHSAPGMRDPRARIPIWRDATLRPVGVICLVIVVIIAGQVSFGTYLAAWLVEVASTPPESIPLVLFLGGVAGAAGLAVNAMVPDHRAFAKFVLSLLLLIAVTLYLPHAAATHTSWVVIALTTLWSLAFAGVPLFMQVRLMQTASVNVRSLAAALQTTAFNIGIGGGALYGGFAIATSGIDALTVWVALAMTGGLIIAVCAETVLRSRRQSR